MVYLGRQVLAELFECDKNKLNDLDYVKKTMIEAAVEANATIVGYKFHKFAPQGVSGVVIIAESHLAIHTWPEHGYAAVDIFTCGSRTEPRLALKFLQSAFRSKRVKYRELRRGAIEDVATSGDLVSDA